MIKSPILGPVSEVVTINVVVIFDALVVSISIVGMAVEDAAVVIVSVVVVAVVAASVVVILVGDEVVVVSLMSGPPSTATAQRNCKGCIS